MKSNLNFAALVSARPSSELSKLNCFSSVFVEVNRQQSFINSSSVERYQGSLIKVLAWTFLLKRNINNSNPRFIFDPKNKAGLAAGKHKDSDPKL